MKRIKTTLYLGTIFIVTFFLFSCNPLENDSLSNTLLVINSIQGSDVDGNPSDYSQSDVVKVDQTTGASYVTSDAATVSFSAEMLNQDEDAQSSVFHDIIITRYIVTYSRSDGRNTPGVDVPYPFEGYLSTRVEVGTTTAVAFVVVREAAKLEPPLIDLQDGGLGTVIQVTATIDFYGHDLANKTVKATGYLTIFFANYNDT
jgi:hypothetical protein